MAIKFHLRSDTEYIDQRYDFIVWAEETGVVKETLYRDSKGYPTIGAGFKVTSNWNDILTAFGFDITSGASQTEKDYIKKIKAKFYTDSAMTKEKTFTTSQIATLQTDLNAIMVQRAGSRTVFAFNNPAEIEATFNIIADEREKTLNNWLAKKGITIPNSNERITLLSLTYNNVIGFKDIAQTKPKSTKLLAALQFGNRAEAWFEIRYNSNGDKLPGIAKRRYYEADYFDLYETGTLTEDEKILQAKTIFRMFTIHKDEISSYDITYGAQVTAANSDYQVTWVKSTTDNLKDAKDYLIANYAEGKSIDNVIVGKGLDSYEYLDKGSYADKLVGTAQKDLIFGEKGSDIIDGSTGNDVIYGGESNDDLNGGEGEDILIGGDGNDILEGGKGNDTLEGGIGNDDYYFQSGDGNDTITDTDGENKIYWTDSNGVPHLMKTFYNSGDAEWKSPDGTVEVNKHSPYKIVLPDGGTITLGEDFQPGDFGIQLKDAPQVPTTTNTILGDQNPQDLEDVLTGTTGNDRIEGREDDDTISSLQGDDVLLGGNGRDAISAGDGNDILEGGAGSDILFGEEGNDQVFGENAGSMFDLISAGENATSIDQTGDLIVGNEGDDQLYGSNSNDALLGGSGGDMVMSGSGDDRIFAENYEDMFTANQRRRAA